MPGDSLRSCYVDNMADEGLDISSLYQSLADVHTSGDVMDLLSNACSHHLDVQGRPGSQLDNKQTFCDRKGKSVTAYPVIVDLRRLVQLGPKECMIKGIKNQDLLHAIVALYDVSLSEMTPDVLYSTVCEKWARSVVLVRDIKETQESLNIQAKDSKTVDKEEEGEEEGTKTSVINQETDTYEGEDVTPSVFAHVFSDVEEEEDEEEEEGSDEEDFSQGIGTFIKSVAKRKKKRKVEQIQVQEEEDIGVEHRLLACATFEKKYVRHKDRVIHLTLISVRPRYRGFGMGKYLLKQLVDSTVVGNYEAVVVHADNSAVEFFQKFGFSDDIVLNSRWSDLAEQFTNCTLMCFLPGFTGASLLSSMHSAGPEMAELEQDFNKWKDKTLEAYQAQVSCVMKMKHEIIQLKTIMKSQSDMLTKLAMENEKLKREKLVIEKDFLSYRLSTASSAFQNKNFSNNSMPVEDDEDGEISTDDLIRSLQQQVDMMDATLNNQSLHAVSTERSGASHKVTSLGESSSITFPCARVRSQQDPNDHSPDAVKYFDITQQFKEGMRADKSFKTNYGVASIMKEALSDQVREAYQLRRDLLVDCSMVTELYYCGSLERPERIDTILTSGFSESDFSHGEYGRGLYFSKYPSKAAQFSALGKLLLVEVGLGKVETVTKQDRTRRRCSEGFDSIITPGRLRIDNSDTEPTLCQEYIVFDVSQVLPVCLISYEEKVE